MAPQRSPLDHPHPAVAVDVVLLTIADDRVRVLVHRRREPPARGEWALPGGFVHLGESPEDAARRLLHAKAGIEGVYLEQLYTFGAPDRDPRAHVISIAYLALADLERFRAVDADEHVVAEAVIEAVHDGAARLLDDRGAPMPLAFDHADIVGTAMTRLQGKLDYTPVGFQLLPDTFTLRQLQTVHETILGHEVNKDSFRRRMLASGQLEDTGTRESDVEHRPARLYRFRA